MDYIYIPTGAGHLERKESVWRLAFARTKAAYQERIKHFQNPHEKVSLFLSLKQLQR